MSRPCRQPAGGRVSISHGFLTAEEAAVAVLAASLPTPPLEVASAGLTKRLSLLDSSHPTGRPVLQRCRAPSLWPWPCLKQPGCPRHSVHARVRQTWFEFVVVVESSSCRARSANH